MLFSLTQEYALTSKINGYDCTFYRPRIVQFIKIISTLNPIGLTKLYCALRIYSVNKAVVTQLKRYFEKNWGAPFIIAFIFLILFIAADLSFSLFSSAEKISVAAFVALSLGVVLQLICFVKYRNSNTDGEVVS